MVFQISRPRARCSKRIIRHRIFVLFLLFASLTTFLVYFPLVSIARASRTFDVEKLASTFVGQVAGWNVSASPNQTPTVGESKRPNSMHTMTDVKVMSGRSNYSVETITTFLDGRLWCFNLYSPIELLIGQKSLNECLTIADLVVTRYQALFNSTSSDGLPRMLSDAKVSQNSTVEDDDALLRVTLRANCTTLLDYQQFVTIEWYKKVANQSIIPALSIRIYISESGLITGFSDGIAINHVATTNISISADQAANISLPYAESYAAAHGNHIAGTVTHLEWKLDSNSQRGDDCAVYPVWMFDAAFNDTSQGLRGYGVSVWADNGQVMTQSPEGTFSQAPRSGTGFAAEFLWVLAGVALTVGSLALCGTYLTRNGRRRHMH